jgi:hypothetical protein
LNLQVKSKNKGEDMMMMKKKKKKKKPRCFDGVNMKSLL